MSPPLLLFPGMPGTTELIIILLLMVPFLIVPLGLVAAAYLFGKRRGRSEVADGDGTERVE
ncbi:MULTISPECIES: hypothetical protein [Haloarcula]|uniref:hypothetical protein n=1 Tax=Haloarcula TaxID=2237 RepID=UPI001668461C|nr:MULTISPECIES: hypothetical protein [Halomicroarcula]MBX0346853.1 hypothetical protein [Halomicroarcula pellucida]MDS0277273.1 hypothetical protein [Halomicroarcula sp. S1AR25-4]